MKAVVDSARPTLLVGAGGHARTVVDALRAAGRPVRAYVDARAADWLDGSRFDTDQAALESDDLYDVAIGLGGMTPAALETRHALLSRYRAAGHTASLVVDPRATTSASARAGAGAQILVGSIVNAGAWIDEAAIVNSGAIVEHDARIGSGSHVAPGAIVLGGARVGTFCMIGAGAVILPGAKVRDRTLVPARAVYCGKAC
ncbi:MAG: hypothetical protein FJX36_11205 [Alphaproteobacteria bacterium]|nr:hypothetical protein [Alphaproteobacteria bacterium]